MKKIFAKGVYINPYSTTNTSNYEKNNKIVFVIFIKYNNE